MAIRTEAIQELTKLIGARETADVIELAKKQEMLESKWRNKFQAFIDKITGELLENASETGRLKFSEISFEEIIMAHSYDIMENGIKSAEKRPPVRAERLAAPPKTKIPSSLRELRKWWDLYRKTHKLPPRQKQIAEKLKKAYIDKLQSVWDKYGEDFRNGDTAETAKALQKIKEGADVAYSRAKMIVETETTYYYNKARRDIYDQSSDVTHYLFMAVRDFATTKWCGTRHGLVYKKGDPLFEKETPPIHWNCRSEILPLTPLNPNHARIINDKTKQRRNNKCEPLPAGWTGR